MATMTATIARDAARTVPRGTTPLAPVRRQATSDAPVRSVPPGRRPPAAVLRRRRVAAVVVLALVVSLAAALIGRWGAEADPSERIAGHVVVAPGDTLWDVAVATTPTGRDAREHLAAIRDLNGLGGGPLAPWTVIAIPVG